MAGQQDDKPTIWQMVKSVLASFAGVQSDSNLDRDDSYIDRHGFRPYIIISIILTLLFVAVLYSIVQIVLYFAS